MCRNICFCEISKSHFLGSPLRVQEHSRIPAARRPVFGITPACAGTFRSPARTASTIWDHPCVCRNIVASVWFVVTLAGSPLRVQEHFKFNCEYSHFFRITPACAGTFIFYLFQSSLIEDHPCVCRNITMQPFICLSVQGSPLRVQEHSPWLLHTISKSRITPACAGTFLFEYLKK